MIREWEPSMSEREDKWVLVPVRPDWSRAMLNALGRGTIGDPRGLYRDMLAARPAIPDDVWEQMVERGARAAFYETQNSGVAKCWHWPGDKPFEIFFRKISVGLSAPYPDADDERREFACGIRAALGISDE